MASILVVVALVAIAAASGGQLGIVGAIETPTVARAPVVMHDHKLTVIPVGRFAKRPRTTRIRPPQRPGGLTEVIVTYK